MSLEVLCASRRCKACASLIDDLDVPEDLKAKKNQRHLLHT